jgi:hypothetical protein
MRKIVELKIEETKTIVGGTKAMSVAAVPTSATISTSASVYASPNVTAGATAARYA